MQRTFALELKALTGDGTFEGIASTYGGDPDSKGDIVEPGAFTRTLAISKERPLLWQHRDPIGTVRLSDSSAGLMCKGKLTLAVQQAKDAYALLKDGVIKGLSIGFETIKAGYNGDYSARHLQELKLWEVSLVTLAANSNAMVTDVKAGARHSAATKDAIVAACKGLQTHADGVKAHIDDLLALIDDEPDGDDGVGDTSEKSAKAKAKTQTQLKGMCDDILAALKKGNQ
jgi:hypothetical protein